MQRGGTYPAHVEQGRVEEGKGGRSVGEGGRKDVPYLTRIFISSLKSEVERKRTEFKF